MSTTEEAMKDEVSNENDEHAEPQGKVTYLLVSKDKDFASKSISRENFFLIGANTKYRPAVRVNSRYIPWKFHYLMFKNLVWCLWLMSIYNYKKVYFIFLKCLC